MRKNILKAVSLLGRLGFVCFGFAAIWTAIPLIAPFMVAEPYKWYVYAALAGGSAMICFACLNVASNADDRIEEMEVWGRC